MSWELTQFVLDLRNLTPVEKSVAHSLAFHAPKHGSARPSMERIAREAGLGHKRAAQKVMRRLESKGVISPTTSKKGGRKNPTRYRFNLNSIPTDALPDTENGVRVDALSHLEKGVRGDPNLGERVSVETRKGVRVDARDSKETEERETAKELTPDFLSEMERKIWGYYIELVNPGPNYSLTIKRKRMLSDRYAEMIAKGQTQKEAIVHLGEAVNAFSEDDYHMGHKKGYEGAGRKGFEQIFGTQELFEDWCSKYKDE